MISVDSAEPIDLSECKTLMRILINRCRSAAREGQTESTSQRALTDQDPSKQSVSELRHRRECSTKQKPIQPKSGVTLASGLRRAMEKELSRILPSFDEMTRRIAEKRLAELREVNNARDENGQEPGSDFK